MTEVVHLERVIPGVGTVAFDDQPVGSPTLKGTPRKRPRRCYHLIREDGSKRELPSVTTVLSKVCPKPSLLRWYESRGAEAALALERAGHLHGVEPGQCAEVLRGLGYGADAMAKQAAGRGTAIHTILERFLADGAFPNLADYPQDWHGFVRSLSRFLRDYEVVPDEDGLERLVAHPELGYAGRLDVRATVNDEPNVLLDLKTNTRGSVYLEHHLQTKAYAMADEACGAPPVSRILIVACGSDGRYEVHEGVATDDMWKCVMALYNTQVSLAEAIKAAAPRRHVVEALAA